MNTDRTTNYWRSWSRFHEAKHERYARAVRAALGNLSAQHPEQAVIILTKALNEIEQTPNALLNQTGSAPTQDSAGNTSATNKEKRNTK